MFKNKYFEICSLLFLLIILFSLNIFLFNRSKKMREVYSQVEITSSYDTIALNNENIKVSLKIINIQMSKMSDEYTYEIKIESKLNSFKYRVNNQEKELNLDENKTGTITIQPNETIVIDGIPFNSKYTITQLNSSDVIINDNKSNTYSDVVKLNNEVLFYNSEDLTTNPESSDSIISFIYLLIIISMIFILLKKFKIKKYSKVF